jgi:glycerophosphoryl diester phosphodiesterase
MADQPKHRRIIDNILRDLRSSWKTLALTDIAFKIMMFVALTPVLGFLFRSLVAVSGSAVLSDQDILYFFLGPAGWCCAIIVGALGLAIFALQQTALMGVVCARADGKRLGVIGAIKFAAAHAFPVVRLTSRIIVLFLLILAPFGAAGALAYFVLLTRYDINFYLKEKPREFWIAVSIGTVVAIALLSLLMRILTSWLFALPLVVFENVDSSRALGESRRRVRGNRRTVLLYILLWAAAMFVLSAITTAIVGAVGRLVIPEAASALRTLAIAIGATLVVWSLANLVINLLSATTFAAMLFNLYQDVGHGSAAAVEREIGQISAAASAPLFNIRRAIAWGAVCVIGAALVGTIALLSVRIDDRVQIMAHRGSSITAPENTLAAFQQAIADKADWIELDVQETADDQVVVFHDSDFMKLARVDLKIWDATIERLKDIDIGTWKAPQFSDQRVPTLADVLDACKGKIRVNIELKYYGRDRQLERRVAEIVESRDMVSQVMVMSLNPDGVRKMKALRPTWKVGQLMSVYAGDLSQVHADFLAVNAALASRSFVRAAHRHGKQVYVWTVNDAPTMSAMIGRGVDGILTDRPALARSVLSQRAVMSAPERLLLELAGVLGVTPEFAEQ